MACRLMSAKPLHHTIQILSTEPLERIFDEIRIQIKKKIGKENPFSKPSAKWRHF